MAAVLITVAGIAVHAAGADEPKTPVLKSCAIRSDDAKAIRDDTPALTRRFEAAAKAGGGVVTIPAGDYFMKGDLPVPIASHITVSAYGARFHLPDMLGDKARAVLFSGIDVCDFRWLGGHFLGHVFDPAKPDNPWEPNVNTRGILITTSEGGQTENLTFRDITSDGIAGAVITVLGAERKGSEREVTTFARNVTVENCTLERSGKFMWDYGYLWQITVWPEEYTAVERAMAAKYFRQDLVRGPLRMEAGDDRVFFHNAKQLPVSKRREGAEASRGRDALCFFGDALPSNLVRGRQYFVVESTPEFIRVGDAPGGAAIRFASAAGPHAKLIHNLFSAHLGLFAPLGSGPGKGALDLVGCEKVIVRGCRLSALGDTMHIQKSRGVVFSGNHVTGSRMGAFFLAEYCKDATITGNTVDGSNGSRVISVEKSCEDVSITGNTFRNGGRGSWINQPRNFVLSNNIFVNNTTKCQRDPRRGRRSFVSGDYERYAELYFTTYEPGGRYGNVIVRGNIFISGPNAEHAIRFEPGGDTLLVSDNIFRGPVRSIAPTDGCEAVTIRDNVGAEVQQNTASTPARTFHSAALGRDVDYSAYIPADEPPRGGWPLVLLLHGAGRNHRSVVDDERCRDELTKCKLVVVCADGAQGWYLDSPVEPASRYQSMLRELLAIARQTLPVSAKPERTGICGWSMGGYGAMRFAEAFPSEVRAVATTIALLDFPNPRLPREQNFPIAPLFGGERNTWAKYNCMTDVEPLRGKRLLIVTAGNAFDVQMNRNFHARLDAAGIAHEFREVPGAHDFRTVQTTLPILFDFLEKKL
jgi:S-formylglutathione hydrolase FrmB